MCGITGIVAFNDAGKSYFSRIEDSVRSLKKRGPDGDGVYLCDNVALGHTRLSIIDTSVAASQPLIDASGRYSIVFNGEFFNFQEHRDILKKQGLAFISQGDTEVLLHLYILEGVKCLDKIKLNKN